MADLIAFYSRKGQNYFDGEIKEVKKGNTEIVAEKITGNDWSGSFSDKTACGIF